MQELDLSLHRPLDHFQLVGALLILGLRVEEGAERLVRDHLGPEALAELAGLPEVIRVGMGDHHRVHALDRETTGLHDSLQLTPRLRAGQPWINERDPASVLHRVAVHVAQARQRDGQLQSQDPRRNLLDTLSRRLPFFTNWLRRGMVVVGHLQSRSGGERRSRSRTAPLPSRTTQRDPAIRLHPLAPRQRRRR